MSAFVSWENCQVRFLSTKIKQKYLLEKNRGKHATICFISLYIFVCMYMFVYAYIFIYLYTLSLISVFIFVYSLPQSVFFEYLQQQRLAQLPTRKYILYNIQSL